MKTFDDGEFEKYTSEAKEKWGTTSAYNEYEKRTKNYSKHRWNDLIEGMERIMIEFSFCVRNEKAPDSLEAQNLVQELQTYITKNYYLCTKEILFDLSQMYVADERFKNNIDKHYDGTAEFIREAVRVYCISN